MQKITKEMLAAAMQCKTADELVELAKSKGYDITREQAEAYLEQSSSCELTDKELDDISGSSFGPLRRSPKSDRFRGTCKSLVDY